METIKYFRNGTWLLESKIYPLKIKTKKVYLKDADGDCQPFFESSIGIKTIATVPCKGNTLDNAHEKAVNSYLINKGA